MKNRMVLYLGVILIVAFYAYDQNTKTETVMPGVVAAIDSRVPEKGGDTWHMRVTLDADEVLLEPRSSRPDVTVGDRICVTETLREGQPSQYFWAPTAVC